MKEKENEDVKVEEKQVTKEKKKNNVIVYAIVFLMVIGLGIGIGYSLNHFNVFGKSEKETTKKVEEKNEERVEVKKNDEINSDEKPIDAPPEDTPINDKTVVENGTKEVGEETFSLNTSYKEAVQDSGEKLPFKVGTNDTHLTPEDYTDISDLKLAKVHKFEVNFNNTNRNVYVFYYQAKDVICKSIGIDDTFIERSICTSKYKGTAKEFIEEDYKFIKNNYHVMKDTETNDEYLILQYNQVSKIDDYIYYTRGVIVNNNIEKMYKLNISDSSFQVRIFAWYGKGIFEHSHYLAKISYEAYEEYAHDDKTIPESREVPCFYSRKNEGVIEYYFVEFKDNYFYMLQPKYDEEGNILDYRDYKVEFKNGVLVPEQIAEYPNSNNYPVETKEAKYIEVITGATSPDEY